MLFTSFRTVRAGVPAASWSLWEHVSGSRAFAEQTRSFECEGVAKRLGVAGASAGPCSGFGLLIILGLTRADALGRRRS